MIASGCIIEIRAAAGGEEAKIWARDLFRMYWKYSQNKHWKSQQINDLTLVIKNPEAFNQLKRESGVHRVQRVPKTEHYGRIHTSTATVVVLPKMSNKEININPADLNWQFYRASSHGGQNVQKVSTAVRLIHKPTNTTVTCEQERFQQQNRQLALELLRTKLWELEEMKKENSIAGYRSSIGRGMRAEKIRTYNFPHNRVTDHRLKKKFRLEDILEGKLEKLITLLISKQP